VKVFQQETQLRTSGGLSVRDITEEVVEVVRESGVVDGIACVYSPNTTCCVRVDEGIACVYSPHTTCCVRVNEFEQRFLEDFAPRLLRLVTRA